MFCANRAKWQVATGDYVLSDETKHLLSQLTQWVHPYLKNAPCCYRAGLWVVVWKEVGHEWLPSSLPMHTYTVGSSLGAVCVYVMGDK